MVIHDARWLALDDAWDFAADDILPKRIEAQKEGELVRFITSQKKITRFYQDFRSQLRPFTLSGSGDFHHLTALFVQQFSEPFVIVSFDNHPDWDIRPPYWSCGAWINRALENPLVKSIAVIGCGSFECLFPFRFLGNALACKEGRLLVCPWRKNGKHYPLWLHPITTAQWREEFSKFAETLKDMAVYITVDMDCLNAEEAVTNWESGLFSADEIVWAINLLRSNAKIIGGDLCGAISTPHFAYAFQRLASRFDRPAKRSIDQGAAQIINQKSLAKIWPVLIG